MEIKSPEKKRVLEEYDFVSPSGKVLPITIEPAAGDTITFGENEIQVSIPSRPSPFNPEEVLPAEDVTIYKAHVVSVHHRTRQVDELTPEQKLEWAQAFKELGSVPN